MFFQETEGSTVYFKLPPNGWGFFYEEPLFNIRKQLGEVDTHSRGASAIRKFNLIFYLNLFLIIFGLAVGNASRSYKADIDKAGIAAAKLVGIDRKDNPSQAKAGPHSS